MPEIQAHAERLTERFAGRVLTGFVPFNFTALKTALPTPETAYGMALVDVGRRGKYLLVRFEPTTFVVNLMQGGRLRPDAKEAKRPRGGLIRWRFGGVGSWLLTEAGTEHKAGLWVVAGDPLTQEPLDHLGPEADTVDAAALAGLFSERSARLHTFLRDQRILAGIGRMLANEVCFRARLSPFAQTSKLGAEEAATVAAAISEAIGHALTAERARTDMSSSNERPSLVHNRTGEACEVCGDTIRAVEYRSYTVCYCATCQTGGKVLADNTTSKFIK